MGHIRLRLVLTMVPSKWNPGSDEAIEMGCTCPVLDNGHGKGAWGWGTGDAPVFWISGDCPVHTSLKEQVELEDSLRSKKGMPE
jgi:hypothetical protein